MENFVVILIVVLIVLGNILYLRRAKKRGETCIGCPYAKQCKAAHSQATLVKAQQDSSQGGHCSGNCSCCSGCAGRQKMN